MSRSKETLLGLGQPAGLEGDLLDDVVQGDDVADRRREVRRRHDHPRRVDVASVSPVPQRHLCPDRPVRGVVAPSVVVGEVRQGPIARATASARVRRARSAVRRRRCAARRDLPGRHRTCRCRIGSPPPCTFRPVTLRGPGAMIRRPRSASGTSGLRGPLDRAKRLAAALRLASWTVHRISASACGELLHDVAVVVIAEHAEPGRLALDASRAVLVGTIGTRTRRELSGPTKKPSGLSPTRATPIAGWILHRVMVISCSSPTFRIHCAASPSRSRLTDKRNRRVPRDTSVRGRGPV